MNYRIVAGDAIATTFDDHPAVLVTNRPAGNSPSLQIQYIAATGASRHTRIEFEGVFWYQWIDEDLEIYNHQPDDYEFGLIEIVDSEEIRRWVTGPPGRGLPGVLKESDLHHYRLGFQGHGTYDIICTDMTSRTIE
jgi:hypothetical protein